MYKITYCSKQGIRREKNEDALLINNQVLNDCGFAYHDDAYVLCAVADGIGGHARGAFASHFILNILKNNKPKNLNELVIALIEARDKLNQYALREKIKLGAVVAGVLGVNDDFLIFNVGDCRVYKIGLNNKSLLLTKDHTLANQLKKSGIDDLVAEEQKNLLTSAIMGGGEKEDFEIFHTKLKLNFNEKLLICSDGFWKVFKDEINKVVQKRDIRRYMQKSRKYKNLNDDYSFILLEKKRISFLQKLLFKFNFIKYWLEY